jgi:hypothetical protein
MRTVDPAMHCMFAFPNAGDVVVEQAERNEDGSVEGPSDTPGYLD